MLHSFEPVLIDQVFSVNAFELLFTKDHIVFKEEIHRIFEFLKDIRHY